MKYILMDGMHVEGFQAGLQIPLSNASENPLDDATQGVSYLASTLDRSSSREEWEYL